MATELIATGTIDATSGDVVAAAGTPVTVFLKAGTGPIMPSDARAQIQVKTVGGVYHTIGALNAQEPVKVIDGPCTFRVQKYANTGGTFGVDQG